MKNQNNMRTLIITLEDNESKLKYRCTCPFEKINEFYQQNNINGITDIIYILNSQLNEELGQDVKFLVPRSLECSDLSFLSKKN